MEGRIRVAAVMALLSCVARTQDAASAPRMLHEYRSVREHIGGIFVTPMAGAPFSATVHVVSHEKLPDGSEHVVTSTGGGDGDGFRRE